jgi:Ser/Thr protein kinase RdoA (MazF antagonist)
VPIPTESESQPVGDAAVAKRILREYHQRGIDPGSFQRLAGTVHGDGVSYLVTAGDGQRLVVRACRADAPVPVQFRRSSRTTPLDWLITRAATLDYLEQSGYPAPRVVRTRSGDVVGLNGVWLTLATSYVEGAVLRPSVGQLRMLGDALGRLHSLDPGQVAAGAGGAGSAGAAGPGRAIWWPGEAIPVTLARLDRVAGLVPPDWQEMYDLFWETVRAVQAAAGSLPGGVVHGDAWAANAVQTGPAQVVLIDWETGGLGVPVLDLGNCLLECLLDGPPAEAGPDPAWDGSEPARPGPEPAGAGPEPAGAGLDAWNVQPDEERIAAVAGGYRRRRALPAGEQAMLLPAIRFGAAYTGAIHFEQALAEGVRGAAMDIRLARLRNRLAVSETVARLAAGHLGDDQKPVR